MLSDTVLRKLPSALIAVLGPLAVGCTNVAVPQDVELEPGIDLPGTTSDGYEESSTTLDSEGPDGSSGSTTDDPEDPTGSTGEPSAEDTVGPPSCSEESFELVVEPPQVMLVLDKSYSMVENQWDHDGDPLTPSITRWNSLHTVVDTLAHDVEGGIELGMVLFPSPSVVDNGTGTACLVDSDPGAPVALLNADAIVDALPAADAVNLYGGTPTSGGMAIALEQLAAVADGRPQAVVLVTDGAANCMEGSSGMGVFTDYDENLSPMVADAFMGGIPTYVIGVDILDAVGTYPQDNPYVRLDELAMSGGVPREGAAESFYNTIDEDELLAALDGITAELGCVLSLTTPAVFTEQITVRVGGVVVPRVDVCEADAEGWRFVEDAAPYQSIELCTMSCDEAHVESGLDVTYACPPQG